MKFHLEINVGVSFIRDKLYLRRLVYLLPWMFCILVLPSHLWAILQNCFFTETLNTFLHIVTQLRSICRCRSVNSEIKPSNNKCNYFEWLYLYVFNIRNWISELFYIIVSSFISFKNSQKSQQRTLELWAFWLQWLVPYRTR